MTAPQIRFVDRTFRNNPSSPWIVLDEGIYSRFRHPHRQNDQPFDRRQWLPQVQRWIRHAGWTIIRTDGTVHQFPFIPGRNPVRWHSLESHRAIRKLLSPFAYTYFVAASKPDRASST